MSGIITEVVKNLLGLHRSLFACLLISFSAFGAHVQTMDTEKRLECPVSGTEINRLSVRGDRITEWVCSDTKMSHEVDETYGHLYLRPLVKTGVVYGTLTTERGSVQDLALKLQKGAPQTLILIPRDQEETETGHGLEPHSEAHDGDAAAWPHGGLRHKAIHLVQRLMAGEGKKGKGRRSCLKQAQDTMPSSLRCLRTLKDQGLEASLYEACDALKEEGATPRLNLWKQEGDIAVGQYRGHLVVVRQAS